MILIMTLFANEPTVTDVRTYGWKYGHLTVFNI